MPDIKPPLVPNMLRVKVDANKILRDKQDNVLLGRKECINQGSMHVDTNKVVKHFKECVLF